MRRTSRSPKYLVSVAVPRRAGRPSAPRWTSLTRELAEISSTSMTYKTRSGTMATPATPAVPVGYIRFDRLAGCVECVSTIRDVSSHRHPTGRPAAFPDGYGLGTRMDRPDRLRRSSHPPDIQCDSNAHERGSCHIRFHPLMGTADVNRCGSVQSLMCDR
jgi:hypothetical protein